MNFLENLSVYVHVPFCKRKCGYCDFVSFENMESQVKNYFNAVYKEIANQEHSDSNVCSVFIGGGTPSYVDVPYIENTLSAIKKRFNISKDCEITIEANPGTLSKEKLKQYLNIGINRLSIGVQAFQDNILTVLGRVHTAEEAIASIKKAKESGFKNINIDLMFGIPKQTIDDWKNTLKKTIELNINHISCYSLKIEEGTPFYFRYTGGHSLADVRTCDEDSERDMYHYTIKELSKAGFKHYEISNFCLHGNECKHNLVYWNRGKYIGIGVGAHSFNGTNRYANTTNLQDYILKINSGIPTIIENESISKQECIFEHIMLGLRLIDGIDLIDFKEKFGFDLKEYYIDKIEKLKRNELININNNKMSLSERGLDLANIVITEFID